MTSSQNSLNNCWTRLIAGALLLLLLTTHSWGSTPPQVGIVTPAGSRIALLPLDNLSGAAAPLREMRGELTERLSSLGVDLLPEAPLEAFLKHHRVRYTGGIDAKLAASLRSEEQVSAALVVNLELLSEGGNPKMALLARLVATTSPPRIIWMESFSLAGHENPGIFGLGLLEDPLLLRRKLLDQVAQAVASELSPSSQNGKMLQPRTFPPRIAFGRVPERGDRPQVAVLPFLNESTRKYASEIMMLHLVHRLKKEGNLEPVEPGIIRDKMLAMRIIMNDGISLSQADLISNNLETDFVLTGRVFDYQDVEGISASPSVDFSAQLMERESRRVVWSSKSYNRGDDGVWFYDWRRVYTASRLADGMAQALAGRLKPSIDNNRPELKQ